ncbi:hypothetical protein BAE44_0002491 [Dichanthelium oligosanthes]|uniref:Uncharacterized protein n=1 Tax=Dichanthelium oligosanthes TaxID=888268 RepID=A0A1E5WH70_9POAL|nr:hypothetical protein BAE44_0002491 [Dichanthelium oligosanthes]
MPSVSSPLAPKGQLMTKHTTAVLLILLSIVLFASSCEARCLRVHGKGRSSSKSHLPDKDVATTSLKADGWRTSQTEARSTVHTAIDDHMTQAADAKATEAVAMASSTAAGTVGATATPVIVRVSKRLSQREDTGFHLDYAGPRTHTPSHN